MREIKFRAWDKITQSMAEVETIDFSTQTVKIAYPQMINGGEVHPLTYHRKFDEVELLQFTGLKDKNGKDIYEGDVLKSETNHYYECIFSDGCFKLKHDFFGVFLPEKWNNIEIIGNIYENPSLLEIKENNSEVKNG